MGAQSVRTEDVALLLSYVEMVDSDPYMRQEIGRLLRWHVSFPKSHSLSSFSRVLEANSTKGNISADLISLEDANYLFHVQGKRELYNFDLTRPLSNAELQLANRKSGCALFVRSFFWNLPYSPLDQVAFGELAIDHLIRWFEGNSIRSIVFAAFEQFLPLVSPLIEALEEGSFQSRRTEDGIHLFKINAPWRPTGLSTPWLKRLLKEYPNPKGDLLSPSQKYKGRVMHEFHFDVYKAAKGCFPDWQITPIEDGDPIRCPSFDKWRSETGGALGISIYERNRLPVMHLIQETFQKNPRILTMY